MRQGLRGLPLVLAVLIGVGTLAGLVAAIKRLQVEDRNKSVEIALEWAEVYQLSQATQQPVTTVLQRLKAEHLTTLVITDDSLSALESTGAIRPTRIPLSEGHAFTRVEVDGPQTLHRIQTALRTHAIQSVPLANPEADTVPGSTLFVLRPAPLHTPAVSPAHPVQGAKVSPTGTLSSLDAALVVPVNYTNLRPLGVGLPPEAMETARKLHLRIAGRIANFPGVSIATAQAALRALYAEGARIVIFYGDDVLGYRGLEKEAAALLRAPNSAEMANTPEADLPPSGLTYGDVEFGKQKGGEKLSAALKGSFVRVHSIQLAEMGQMDENEMLERFTKAVRERNIRFCYVRLFTLAGDDPIGANVAFLHKIRAGLAHGNAFTGGGFKFGAAHRYADPNVPTLLFGLIGLGVAAGIVWMLRAFCPVSPRLSLVLLVTLCVVCGGLATVGGESGRKMVALLGGIALPAVACLRTFPHAGEHSDPQLEADAPRGVCVKTALRKLALASAITALGIVQVVGLLASRPFMVHASQFLGIKAQHAVPLLLVALAALLGGVPAPGESWRRFRQRATERLQAAYNEPARFGLLVLGIVALAGLAVVVARTGNDSGVGVSSFELRFRAILDMLLVARPRTKEFLVGHPAFILGWAWWLRGRRNLAVPLLIVGSLGQVSMLNTFCHIHTPLVISAWRDLLGLVFGAILGVGVFLCVDPLLPAVASQSDPIPEEGAVPNRPALRPL